MPPYYIKYKQFLKWLVNIETTINLNLQGNNSFSMTVVRHNNQIIGVEVSNLGATPFLPIEIFRMTFEFLSTREDNRATKGNAIQAPVGNPGMELDTIEGLIAHNYYNTQLGTYAFSRITPIANILGNARTEMDTPIVINGYGFLQLFL
jgi:hypothetical protein